MNLMRALSRDLGLLIAIVALGFGQTPDRPGAAADVAEFETVCGACHDTSLISDIRTEPEWRETIEQMVGIPVDAGGEQLKAVLRFLLRSWTRVNVNTATAAELPLVLDISEATAQALVKYREAHGKFKSFEDLKKVPGLNAAKLQARQNRIAF